MENERDESLASLLAAYGAEFSAGRIVPHGSAGGFSGARIWHLETPKGPFCLRAWPREHPTLERLRYIHGLLAHVWQQGFHKVPVPVGNLQGESAVWFAGRFWEIAPWLPGTADFRQRPSRARLAAAMVALARFHLAAESYTGPHEAVASNSTDAADKNARDQLEPAPGVGERLQILRSLQRGELKQIAAALKPNVWPALYDRARYAMELFQRTAPRIEGELVGAETLAVRLQPCLRDMRHDHVLFTGDEVSGIVDFGAARRECVAADLSRLLGSLLGDDDPAGWRFAVDAYHPLRPLSEAERDLIRTFDRSGVLLGPMFWLRWIYRENRRFDSPQAVSVRFEEGLRRLERLAAC